MPQRKNAIKELRKAHKKHMHNLDLKTELKKLTKQFLLSVKTNKKDDAKSNLSLVCQKLDKLAKRNLIHKNTVSRRKSRFSKLFTAVK